MLYWCVRREEELFALTPKDFDFKKKTFEINKTFTVIKGETIVSLPKTSKTQLNLMLQKYSGEAGVGRIRVNDLRHSHVSLLIHMGFSAVAIGKRVGHKSERITYYYAHLFPGVQKEISERLDQERKI